ncbi:hypothetical protein DFJ74DRAFT_692018 [Hyaloraphidium curvatum]|nr:hypothetical protein DFJ74DRAFT_692018 [Hyaloraphidium curvatum]
MPSSTGSSPGSAESDDRVARRRRRRPVPARRPASGVPDPVSDPLAVPPGTLAACLSAVFEHVAAAVPVLHRPSVLAALGASAASPGGDGPPGLDGGSPWGGRPLALLCAVAANAVRLADLPLTATERRRAGFALAERARAYLASGYLARQHGGCSPSPDAISDLEAVQAMIFLGRFLGPEGLYDQARAVGRRAWDTLASAALAGHGAAAIITDPHAVPADASEWAAQEMWLRAASYLCWSELNARAFTGEIVDPTTGVLAGPLALPCSEDLFLLPADDAFALCAEGARPRAVVDPSPLLVAAPDPGAAHAFPASLLSPVLDGRASRTSVWVLLSLISRARVHLRALATLHALDPVLVASSDPGKDSMQERALRTSVSALLALSSGLLDALPQLRGPPEALHPLTLRLAETFGPGPATGLLTTLLVVAAAPVFLLTDLPAGSPAPPGLFSSPAFLTALDGSAACLSVMRWQLARPRTLPSTFQTAFIAVLKVGAFLAGLEAAVGGLQESWEGGAATCLRYAEALGAFHPVGTGPAIASLRALIPPASPSLALSPLADPGFPCDAFASIAGGHASFLERVAGRGSARRWEGGRVVPEDEEA